MNTKVALLAFIVAFTLLAVCVYASALTNEATKQSTRYVQYPNIETNRGITIELLGDPIDNPGGPTTK